MTEKMVVKNVDLMGDSIMAAKDNDGTIWVGIKWMCKGMGMSEGQWKRQIANIKKDLLLQKAGSNLILPTVSGDQEVFCLKNDYLPIWLAKISITPTIQQENPDLADKLLEYQLRAKEVLAEAFNPKQVPVSTNDKIMLLAQGHMELQQEVDNIKKDMESLKMDLPILPVEEDRITSAVKRKGLAVMGGKTSNVYRDKSIRRKVYQGIYANLKYNFQIKTYRALKRSQVDKAIEIINNYQPPYILAEQIDAANAQQTLIF